MKRSDETVDTQTGKFIARATPLGTVTEGMVIQRAKELAILNSRNANDYTQDDYEQARRELLGLPEAEPAELAAVAPDAGRWLDETGDGGDRAPLRPARDEQTFAEQLVKEGVEEATHHQMLAGNQYSREHDQS